MATPLRMKFVHMAVFAVILVFGSLFVFTLLNSERITKDNRLYLRDNTQRVAEDIDEEIMNGYTDIEVISRLVNQSLTGPDFDIANLRTVVKTSLFDFMEFADAQGNDHNITGSISNARDRQYYLDAKAGHMGMQLIPFSRATHETLLMYYAPLQYKEQFVGSLVGVYEADSKLSKKLASTFFGDSATSYLLSDRGRVIACSQGFDPSKPLYISDLARANNKMKEAWEKVQSQGGAHTFEMPGNATGGCLAAMPKSHFYILQFFPEKANSNMTASANRLGLGLTGLLLCTFIILGIFFLRFHRTQQHRIETAMKQAEDANAAKTSFLFNMSHDIRTPMNAIIGFRRLLEKYQDNPTLRADYLRKIDTASQTLLSIINNVLQMARIEKGTIVIEETPWSMQSFEDTINTIFRGMMSEKGIDFTDHIDVEHRYFYCDTTKLREVFYNLLSNAYKYTPAGGSVSLQVRELTRAEHDAERAAGHKVPDMPEGYTLYRTTLRDTGIGMSEEFLPHLFEEFARETNEKTTAIEGTGLGMPIVGRLVELMHGTIEVESRKGEGTTFILTLPHRIAATAAESQQDKDVDFVPSHFEGKRVLLAEDNDMNAEIAIDLLAEYGLDVDRAHDGREAVSTVEEAPAGYYSMVLMDVQMPFMDGYEATTAIRTLPDAAKASIPIVAMTANAFEEDRRNAFRAGMNGHVAKPIDMTQLLKVLARYCGE